MIIWGWRTLHRNGPSGRFHCHACGCEQDYRVRRLQRFFTLYFIPIIPLKVVAEAAECQACKTQWKVEVLLAPVVPSAAA
ncbi:MAG: zinc-ribbon domain-containing protein [Proteobacteria bacterium]|nr:zinc-ribbon domain-containing protein [Pseudomonadota bacterium]